MTTLLDTHVVEKLMNFVERNVLETHQNNYDAEQTLGSAKLLHSFLGLILSEHTGRRHKLSQVTKELYLNRLNTLSGRLKTQGRDAIEILYELESARELLICITDTNKLRLLCEASIKHILSPEALLSDLKKLAFDIPSTWYVTLLELTLLADSAKHDRKALTHLQTIAAKQSDWHFQYGMISLLLNIIVGANNPEICKQAINGLSSRMGISLLGLIQLLSIRSHWLYWQNTWIQRQAKWALNQASAALNPTDRAALGVYLVATPVLHTPRASIVKTPFAYAPHEKSEDVATASAKIVNPLHPTVEIWRAKKPPRLSKHEDARIITLPTTVRSMSKAKEALKPAETTSLDV